MPNEVRVQIKGERKSRILSIDRPIAATDSMIAEITREPRRTESHGLTLVHKPPETVHVGFAQSGARQFRRGRQAF